MKANNERMLVRMRVGPMAAKAADAEVGEAQGRGGAAAGKLAEALVQVKQTEELLSHQVTVAPIDGLVTQLKVKEGVLAEQGTPIARVFDTSDLVVQFAVPVEDAERIKAGEKVWLTVDGTNQRVLATVKKSTRAGAAGQFRSGPGRHRRLEGAPGRDPRHRDGPRADRRSSCRCAGSQAMSVVTSVEIVSEGNHLETPTWVTSFQGMPRTVNVRRCRLEVVAGTDVGKIIELAQPAIMIGRTASPLASAPCSALSKISEVTVSNDLPL